MRACVLLMHATPGVLVEDARFLRVLARICRYSLMQRRRVERKREYLEPNFDENYGGFINLSNSLLPSLKPAQADKKMISSLPARRVEKKPDNVTLNINNVHFMKKDKL